MNAFYFDTSALIKRYLLEQGTGWVRALVAASGENTILVARLSQVEILSGVMRRHREGTVNSQVVYAIRLLLDRQIGRDYTVVELTHQVVKRAGDLLQAHPLRAADAIQLASALEADSRLRHSGLKPLTFVTADERLLAAGDTEGLPTENPNAYI